MAVTYASSTECANKAGMKAQSANSFPTTIMIDGIREDVYAMIGGVVGMAVADTTNSVLKRWEKKKVALEINNMRFNRNIEIEFTIDEVFALQSDYNADGGDADLGMEFFEPNLNE